MFRSTATVLNGLQQLQTISIMRHLTQAPHLHALVLLCHAGVVALNVVQRFSYLFNLLPDVLPVSSMAGNTEATSPSHYNTHSRIIFAGVT